MSDNCPDPDENGEFPARTLDYLVRVILLHKHDDPHSCQLKLQARRELIRFNHAPILTKPESDTTIEPRTNPLQRLSVSRVNSSHSSKLSLGHSPFLHSSIVLLSVFMYLVGIFSHL